MTTAALQRSRAAAVPTGPGDLHCTRAADSVPVEALFPAGGVDGVLRDAVYQWYEQRRLAVDVFGPFAGEAVCYARRIAGLSCASGDALRHSAYRLGRCVDCVSAPHSAGRIRCLSCHRSYIDRLARGGHRLCLGAAGAGDLNARCR